MQLDMLEVSMRRQTLDVDREDTLRLQAIRRRILAVAKHKFARLGYAGVALEDGGHRARR